MLFAIDADSRANINADVRPEFLKIFKDRERRMVYHPAYAFESGNPTTSHRLAGW